jgi:hypothetical protein
MTMRRTSGPSNEYRWYTVAGGASGVAVVVEHLLFGRDDHVVDDV